jgi:hypothetical protein
MEYLVTMTTHGPGRAANPWIPDPPRVSSAAPAISAPTPMIAASTAPAAVS